MKTGRHLPCRQATVATSDHLLATKAITSKLLMRHRLCPQFNLTTHSYAVIQDADCTLLEADNLSNCRMGIG